MTDLCCGSAAEIRLSSGAGFVWFARSGSAGVCGWSVTRTGVSSGCGGRAIVAACSAGAFPVVMLHAGVAVLHVGLSYGWISSCACGVARRGTRKSACRLAVVCLRAVCRFEMEVSALPCSVFPAFQFAKLPLFTIFT